MQHPFHAGVEFILYGGVALRSRDALAGIFKAAGSPGHGFDIAQLVKLIFLKIEQALGDMHRNYFARGEAAELIEMAPMRHKLGCGQAG